MDDDRDWAHSSEYSRQGEATPMTAFVPGTGNRNASSHNLLAHEERGRAMDEAPAGQAQQYFDVDKKEGHSGTA
jgi:hypothetical protein